LTGLPAPLGEDRVHLWCVALRAPVELERAFEQTLSSQEAERSRRFATLTLRRRFALSHGVLRLLLSRYLNIAPAKIVFGYGPAGKPFIENDGAGIQFNMSHSDDLAVYAFARNCRLGVDVERIRSMPDLMGVAKLSFSEQEYGELLSLPDAEQTAAFFRCWTRKEAYVKAVGQGLSLALESFQVNFRPEQPVALRVLPPGDRCQTWQIRDIAPPGYAGAVVFDGADHAVEEKPLCAAEDLI